MATRRTKNGDDEKLDATNLEKVIALLEPEEGKPISKKDACAILNISYNTARLASLIEKHKEKKAVNEMVLNLSLYQHKIYIFERFKT